MVRKEDLPSNSVFGKVLSEIWALKVLLKQLDKHCCSYMLIRQALL